MDHPENSDSSASFPPVLETTRLRLVPATLDDAEFILRLFNDELFIRYIDDRKIRTLQQATDYLQKQLGKFATTPQQLFVVRRHENETAIGVCSLLQREVLDDPDIGFAFLPDFRGQGFALEATIRTLKHAREDLGLKRIVAIAAPDNLASISLLHKLGFQRDSGICLTPESEPSVLFVLNSI